jgi:hypothetical protein
MLAGWQFWGLVRSALRDYGPPSPGGQGSR